MRESLFKKGPEWEKAQSRHQRNCQQKPGALVFTIGCKEVKIAQIFQLNQLFQLLHLVRIYAHGFNELSRTVIRKNVNNHVSKDTPIGVRFREVLLERDLTVRPGLRTRILFINQTKKRRDRRTPESSVKC